MPLIGPVKRSALIRYLRKLGFNGPYSGGKHPGMEEGRCQVLNLPNMIMRWHGVLKTGNLED
jgi:hypothetical protein